MPAVASIDGLTPMQRAFAENYAQGFTVTQAAKRAGYDNPGSSGADQLRKPHVLALIEELRAEHIELSAFTRQQFIEGMVEAIEMARVMSDPQTMIIGYRELGKACGHYEPQKIEVSHNHTGTVRIDQLNQMSDEDLMKLIEEKPAIEGTAERVDG